MLTCLGVKNKRYEKRSIIMLAEDNADHVGIVLRGAVLIVKEDFVGNRSIVDRIGQYDMFGEAFACAGIQKSPVTVVAAENCEIMWIQFRRIINTCSTSCIFHSKLIENMMKLLALKNLQMNQKLEITSKRNLRDKLTAYLFMQAKAAKSFEFTIPLSRSELADYLYVDRSALSRELGSMRDEGIIEFNKNHFCLRRD
ncbi:MAG TPA: Crp/Fnr family transcriptional regulator, partial [Syntrophomonadaceae bacterium]|nr:Crp/Fnr family transcriptional regulator [Syntrophomonadaceae bacterium]